mgnify:CR=1 FL=1
MLKHGTKSKIRNVMLVSLLLLAGCVSVSQNAICDSLMAESDDLTVALLIDGGPLSQEAGVALISGLDGACL